MPCRSVTRRAVIASTLATVASSCRRPAPRDGKLHLRFSVWGEPVEMVAFRRLIARYEQLTPGVAIDLEQIGYRTRTQLDTQIAAGVGPDLFRVTYLDVGRYSPSNALIDLSPYLPPAFGDAFTPPVWSAVTYRGRPHALPHHTDTSAILYNKIIFDRLGIRPPQTLADSWHWEEFLDVAGLLKTKACDYAFAVNWALGGSFRWLNFLYQRGGALLASDFRTPAIPSDAARETVEWTQSFFRRGLIPMSDSAKSSEQVENLFATGVVGMYFDVGPQSLRELHPAFPWGATFLPRDRRFAADLGGTAVGVCRNCPHPEAAARFAIFLTNEDNMRRFALDAQFLPVRKNLLVRPLPYAFHPDEMRIHLEQSTTVPVDLARTVTIPAFHRIGRVLGDELDLAFIGGQSADDTLRHIALAVSRAT